MKKEVRLLSLRLFLNYLERKVSTQKLIKVKMLVLELLIILQDGNLLGIDFIYFF